MSEKKILWIVTYNFHPIWAGPAERFLRYYKGLTDRNIDVTYITVKRDNKKSEDVYRGAKIIRLGNSEKTLSIKKFISLASDYALKSKLKPTTFLVLLADILNASDIRKLSLNGINTIYVNTMAFRMSVSKNIFKRWGSHYLNYRFFNSFNSIVCSTEALKKPIIKLGVNTNKIKIISNGVSLTRFCPAKNYAEEQSIRASIKLPNDEPIALFIGLRLERKGVVDLIKSWQLYKKRGGKGYLVMVGGEQRNNPLFESFYLKWDEILVSIKEEDNIIMHPPSNEVEKYFKISRLFIFLSKQEGMPNVLTEAMASGCPVITTRFEGFSDAWGKSGEQLLIVNRDYNEISSKIDLIMSDDNYHHTTKNAALEFVEKEHAIENTLDKYADLVK